MIFVIYDGKQFFPTFICKPALPKLDILPADSEDKTNVSSPTW